MASHDIKTVEPQSSKNSLKQPRRPRPDALSLLSSLMSSDDATGAQTPKLVSPLPINLELLQAQPLPLALMREPDESVRRTLSQDWLKEQYSPRPGSADRSPFSEGSPLHDALARGIRRQSLASIAEDEDDEDSEVSGDALLVSEEEIGERARVLSNTEDCQRPEGAQKELDSHCSLESDE